jgi:hypothetical protein
MGVRLDFMLIAQASSHWLVRRWNPVAIGTRPRALIQHEPCQLLLIPHDDEKPGIAAHADESETVIRDICWDYLLNNTA